MDRRKTHPKNSSVNTTESYKLKRSLIQAQAIADRPAQGEPSYGFLAVNLTQVSSFQNYNNKDDALNELIGMESCCVNASRSVLPGPSMPKQKTFQALFEECKLCKLPPASTI